MNPDTLSARRMKRVLAAYAVSVAAVLAVPPWETATTNGIPKDAGREFVFTPPEYSAAWSVRPNWHRVAAEVLFITAAFAALAVWTHRRTEG